MGHFSEKTEHFSGKTWHFPGKPGISRGKSGIFQRKLAFRGIHLEEFTLKTRMEGPRKARKDTKPATRDVGSAHPIGESSSFRKPLSRGRSNGLPISILVSRFMIREARESCSARGHDWEILRRRLFTLNAGMEYHAKAQRRKAKALSRESASPSGWINRVAQTLAPLRLCVIPSSSLSAPRVTSCQCRRRCLPD